MQRTDLERPWQEFALTVPEESKMLFQAATRLTTRDGRKALFWEDRWIGGLRVQEIAPLVYERVTVRVRATKTVREACEGGSWALDVEPNLSAEMLQQFLRLWACVAD